MATSKELKVGDKVTTIHGEKLTVLKLEKIPVKVKGEPTGEMIERFLAESGGTKCWFPTSKIKEPKGKETE